ncbi:MAG: hypothetical protein WDN75_05875 [Bacteroidota bacterium]
MIKKKSKKKEVKKSKEVKMKPSEEAVITEKPFDFGGLPDRDLKKNLGCG